VPGNAMPNSTLRAPVGVNVGRLHFHALSQSRHSFSTRLKGEACEWQ
jgi:hypothetical protein